MRKARVSVDTPAPSRHDGLRNRNTSERLGDDFVAAAHTDRFEQRRQCDAAARERQLLEGWGVDRLVDCHATPYT